MEKVARVLGSGFLAIAVLIGLALSITYLASEPQLRRTYEVALRPIVVPTDAASIAEGRRLATIRGCNDGCHGKCVSGTVFWDEPWIARMVAPDLTRVAAQLSDEELGRIIAFLRSLPVGDGPEAEIEFGPLGRIELLKNPLYA
jgi:ABC-type uncharacterized transport system YnjBCD permease subunit